MNKVWAVFAEDNDSGVKTVSNIFDSEVAAKEYCREANIGRYHTFYDYEEFEVITSEK